MSTPGLLLDGFFPALCHFCIGFHRFAKSQWAGKVFSGGFVSKTLRWISFQPHWLHFPKPTLTSLIAAWSCFQWCSCVNASETGLPLSYLLHFHHHRKKINSQVKLPNSQLCHVPSSENGGKDESFILWKVKLAKAKQYDCSFAWLQWWTPLFCW